MGCGRAVWLSRLAQVLRRASRLCLLASSLLCPCQSHQPLQDGDVFDGDKRLGELGRGKADEGNSRAHNALPLFAAFLLSQAVGRVSGHGTLEESVYVAYKTRGSQTPSPRAHPPDKHVCDCGSRCLYYTFSSLFSSSYDGLAWHLAIFTFKLLLCPRSSPPCPVVCISSSTFFSS